VRLNDIWEIKGMRARFVEAILEDMDEMIDRCQTASSSAIKPRYKRKREQQSHRVVC
jgi:hypothetical protein